MNGGKPVLCLVAILVLGVCTNTSANPTDGGNPYQAIVDRNVFGLKPPAPPPDPEANKPPPAKLTLTGVYKMGGGAARALIKVAVPPRPPDPAKEIPLILSEGQGGEGVEVLSIDTVASTVKVNNSGTVMTLDFTNNGAKLAGSAPAAGGKPPGVGVPPAPNPFTPHAPGAPPPTARPVRSTSLPGAPISPAGYSGTSVSGSAQPVTTYTALPTTYNTSSGINVGGTASGSLTVPGLGTTASTYQPQRNWPPEPQTAEESAIMGAAYSQKYAQEIQAGTMPSLPGDNPLLQNQQTTQPTTTPAPTPNMPPLPPGAARRYVPQ